MKADKILKALVVITILVWLYIIFFKEEAKRNIDLSPIDKIIPSW